MVKRRDFLAGAAALAAAGSGARAGAGADSARKRFSQLRSDFPWAEKQVYLNSAGLHPVSEASRRAMEAYLAYRAEGPGEGRRAFTTNDFQEVKRLYGKLINAKPAEIAFIQSTQVGENIVAAGLGLPQAGGNVVTDEFHFHGALYHYKMLEKAGLEVRIVKQRDWRIELSDMEKAVDRNTKLVAITLVSNINGHLHDAKALSELAHAHGAYLFADVIQAAGCIPLDVRAMGIDFCSAGTYKWLMGLRGLGYLYVREELQDVVKTTRYGSHHYRDFTYHNFPGSPAGPGEFTWRPQPGAAKYEIGSVSDIAAVCQKEALRYILDLGVDRIQAHARPLAKRALEEIPRFGYPAITPLESPTPIAAFLVEKEEPLRAKLAKANVAVKVKWNQMRISPSIFNNEEDIDRLLEALG